MASSNLQIYNGLLTDDLNCVKCKSIPKDACLVPCGCRLCRICIKDLMENVVKFCPGPSEECGASRLSMFVIDYRANRNISEWSTRCPNKGCVHECPLAIMEEHLRVCPRKSVECPFRELGCTQKKMAAQEMNGHLQRESLSHSEILIGMINNVNNEMGGSKRMCGMMKKLDENNKRQFDVVKKTIESYKAEISALKKADEDNKTEIIEALKGRDESNKAEIQMLKYQLELKDRQIKSIMNEIKSMKVKHNFDLLDMTLQKPEDKNKECTNRMKILLGEIKRELDETRDSAITKVIEYVDKGVTAIKKDIISINQGTKSVKADIYSLKSQIKVPTDYSLTETVLSVLVSALEKQKDQHCSGRDGDENVPEIEINPEAILRGLASSQPRNSWNLTEDRTFNYDSYDQQRGNVTNNDINVIDRTMSLRNTRFRGRPVQRRSFRFRGPRFGMEAAATYRSGDKGQGVRNLRPDSQHDSPDPPHD